MTKQKRQVGRRKEAPLAVVGSNTVQEEKPISYQEKLVVYYRELLRGFFNKFDRWQAITDVEGYKVDKERRKLEVFATSNGLHIAQPGETPNLEDKILE